MVPVVACMMQRRYSNLASWHHGPRATALAVAALLLATSCGGGDGGSEPTPPPATISPTARAYLEQLIGIMQANSINRLTID